MSLSEKLQQDMVAAMKSRESERLSTLRMMKAALKNREIEKRGPLTDAESNQVLVTMVKQRRDSVEQFTRGNRPELAEKEAAEIPIIESYMPKAAGEEQLRGIVEGVLGEMASAGQRPSARDMGMVMKAVQSKLQAAGVRAEGRQVSELVKAALAGNS